jgi:hypothetical protein
MNRLLRMTIVVAVVATMTKLPSMVMANVIVNEMNDVFYLFLLSWQSK